MLAIDFVVVFKLQGEVYIYICGLDCRFGGNELMRSVYTMLQNRIVGVSVYCYVNSLNNAAICVILRYETSFLILKMTMLCFQCYFSVTLLNGAC